MFYKRQMQTLSVSTTVSDPVAKCKSSPWQHVNGCGCVPIKLYLQTQVVGQIGAVGLSLWTPTICCWFSVSITSHPGFREIIIRKTVHLSIKEIWYLLSEWMSEWVSDTSKWVPLSVGQGSWVPSHGCQKRKTGQNENTSCSFRTDHAGLHQTAKLCQPYGGHGSGESQG